MKTEELSAARDQQWHTAPQQKARQVQSTETRWEGAASSPTSGGVPRYPKKDEVGRSAESSQVQPKIETARQARTDEEGLRSRQEIKSTRQGQDQVQP